MQKNPQVYQYIQNQLSRAPALLKSKAQDDQGKDYLPRALYPQIKQLVDDFSKGKKEPRIVSIPGLRGVGKTTLLAQVFLGLSPKHQKELLYISVDHIVNLLRSDLNTALNEYQEILGISFEKLNKNIYLFIDEIHYDKKWPQVLKSIYDRSKNIFILCTGSSALSLQRTTDIARRVIFEKMYPMDFTEVQLLKSQNKIPIKLRGELKKSLFHSNDAQECLAKLEKLQKEVNNYWLNIDRLEINQYLKFGSMPFALELGDEAKAQQLMNEVIDRVIERDLLELEKFKVQTLEKVKNILLMLASSDEVSITSLAKSIQDVSVNTLIDVLAALEKAEMLIRVYPYGSAYKKVRKPSKYYFMTPAIRYTLLSLVEGDQSFEKYKGKLLEDVVALYLHRKFSNKGISAVYYDSAKGGADFIVQLGKKKIVIEVGFGDKGTNQAIQTLEKVKGDYGFVVCDSQLKLLKEDSVIKLPLEYFLLI